MKLTKSLRVYLGVFRSPDQEFSQCALGVIEGMDGNPNFPNPPVPLKPPSPTGGPTDLTTLNDSFTAACVAAASGGTQLTADKNQKRALLEDAMHTLAMYVQGIARYDLAMMLSSGFEACSTNHASVPLTKPSIVAIVNETSGQLLVRGQSVLNARSYQAQMSADGGKTWQEMGDYTGARRIVLAPVTPGTVYTVRIRAVGGSTIHSDWSDPSSHIAT
jgi:hypothetical protein